MSNDPKFLQAVADMENARVKMLRLQSDATSIGASQWARAQYEAAVADYEAARRIVDGMIANGAQA